MLNKELGGHDMQEVFENIIEMLEEEKNDLTDWTEDIAFGLGIRRSIEIVKQEAEKFGTDTNVGSNGWIPCSERLPEDDSICIVTVEYPNNETVVDYGWFDRKSVCWFVGTQEFRTSNILAWQPLPEPFKECD